MSVTFPKLAARTKEALAGENLPELSEEEIRQVLLVAVNEIGKALSTGEDVFLDGFGRFYAMIKTPRKVRSCWAGNKKFDDPKEYNTGFKVQVVFNPFSKLMESARQYLEDLNLTDLVEENTHE